MHVDMAKIKDIQCPKKSNLLMFDNNFGKCGPIFKFFHQLIREKILYVHTQRLPSHLQYVATLPRESQKSKNVTDFDILNKLVNMFLRML